MSVQTAWEARELGGVVNTGRVLFGRMYEDAAIECDAFAGASKRIFAIASAGCTAMALARAGHRVVACDINPAQLEYARRRIEEGAPRQTGAAERVMAFARRFAPLVGWREAVLREFLAMDDPGEQFRFWSERLDTARFRAGFDTMMSPRLLRLVYSSPLLAFLPSRFGVVLRARLERGFARHPNATNPFARALLLGEDADETRGPVAGVEFVAADAASYLESCEPASFDGFTLSNILDGATPSYRERLFAAVHRAASGEHVPVVLRSFAEPAESAGLAAADRSLLWGSIEAQPISRFDSGT